MRTKIAVFMTAFYVLIAVAPASAQHPRIWLTTTLLATLRQRAAANSASWQALAAQCDLYLTGKVDWPDGNDYPDGGDIGEGYQGDGYIHSLINLSLAYQITTAVAPADAPKYAAKGIDILTKMSAPSGSHAVDPLRDDGYGIRNYGVGMAIGYDWLYAAMTPAQRTRVYTALNRWIDAFEQGGFENDFPQGNYFAGYYDAKALAALATEGDNPKATDQWNDWLNRLHNKMVRPYYAAHMAGGGWPEGWNYGPLGTLNMWYPIWATWTAKGIDLLHMPGQPYTWPIDQGLHVIHFTWPNRLTLDDRNLTYDSDNPTATLPDFYTPLAGLFDILNEKTAPYLHNFARTIRTLNPDAPPQLWQDFLFWDDAAHEMDFTTLPLSYESKGMGLAAMRSSWATNAVWASFLSGPYVNNPDNGEEFFDKGSLAIVRGGTPLLVNATGALLRDTPGTNDGSQYFNPIYNDNFGGNRTLYNVFYVHTKGSYGENNNITARTRLQQFEDGHGYVFARGNFLQDMYRPDPATNKSPVTSWIRDVVYLRPDLFVVYDRTLIANPAQDQWMAFHLAKTPTQVTSPSPGTTRYDINGTASFVGAMTRVLPASAPTKLVNVFGSDKVYRVEVRPTTAGAAQQWLTVFDASTSAMAVALASRLSAADGNVLAGNVQGVVLARTAGNWVVLAGTDLKAAPVAGAISYVVPAVQSVHVLTDLPASTSYAVSVSVSGGEQTVTVAPGVGFKTTRSGVLYLNVSANGTVTPGA